MSKVGMKEGGACLWYLAFRVLNHPYQCSFLVRGRPGVYQVCVAVGR